MHSRGRPGPARDGGGRLGGQLLVAAAIFTVVNNYLPGSEHLDIAVLNAAAAVAFALGVAAWFTPWHRLHPRAPLVLALAAFALIAITNRFGGVSSYSYAVYFVVVFVWLGIAQPPFTSLAMSPVATVAYLWPLATGARPAPHGVASFTVAIPVCVLVGETIARTMQRLRDTQAQLAERVAFVEQQRNHEQAVIDAVADGLLVADGAGCVISCNATAAAMLDTDMDALVGQPVPFALAAHGVPVEHEVAPGRWLEVTSAPLPGTDETVVALHDVSRQRALKEAQDLFLATTSHELRTPLTVVKGYLGMLLIHWDVLDDEQRLDAVRFAAGRTDDLVSLVNHLLLAARAGIGRPAMAIAPFDLVEKVESVVNGIAATSTKHEFDLTVADPIPPVLGDPSTVEPIVGQLLENAVKYSPDGGAVSVGLRTVETRVVIEVGDEGVGLPPGGEEHIFTPFFQGSGGDRREYGGVGLGLHIVRQLAVAQGGTVVAGNRPTGGAVFTVTLPLATVGERAPVTS